jgi:hypothetical protein
MGRLDLRGMWRATLWAMSGWSRRRILQWAAVALLATGCLSPTLPLPPPSPPDVTNIGEGQFRIQGSIPVVGTALIRNTRTQLVYGQAETQTFDIVVAAESGDRMILWYESSGDTSDPVQFRIDDGANAPPVDAGKD